MDQPGHVLERTVYPKAQVLNRFIAKVIDLLIVAAAVKLAAGRYSCRPCLHLVCRWLWGRSECREAVIGLQTIVRAPRDPAGFRESIIRNLPLWSSPIGI